MVAQVPEDVQHPETQFVKEKRQLVLANDIACSVNRSGSSS